MNGYPSGTGGISTIGRPHSRIRFRKSAICNSKVGIFLSLVAITSFSKRDAASIDRDLHSLIGEDATLFLPESDFDFILGVKWQLLTAVQYQQFRQAFWQSNISAADQNFVLPLAPVKLPWSLEQLKKLLHDHVFRRISDDSDHANNFWGPFESCHLGGTQFHSVFVSLKNLAHHAHKCLSLLAPYVP